MKSISFFVPGVPATQGSKTGFPIKDKKTGKIRVVMAPASKKERPWRADVKYFANQKMRWPLFRGPVALTVYFLFSRPKSHFGTGKNSSILKPNAPDTHTKKPDLSKLIRAVEDALKGVVWVDDSQVVYQRGRKMYVDDDSPKPGAKILVEEFEVMKAPLAE